MYVDLLNAQKIFEHENHIKGGPSSVFSDLAKLVNFTIRLLMYINSFIPVKWTPK